MGCSPTKLCGDREAKRTCMQSGFREVEGDAEVEGSCISQNLNAEELYKFLGIPLPTYISPNFPRGEGVKSISRVREAWNLAMPAVDKVCEILVRTPHQTLLQKGLEKLYGCPRILCILAVSFVLRNDYKYFIQACAILHQIRMHC